MDTALPDTPGTRLRAYIDDHWSRQQGGIRGLAAGLGTTPETMYEWFRDEREPSLAHLREMARLFGVNRSDVVAVMDGEEPAVRLDARLEALIAERIEAVLDERLGPRAAAARQGPR